MNMILWAKIKKMAKNKKIYKLTDENSEYWFFEIIQNKKEVKDNDIDN